MLLLKTSSINKLVNKKYLIADTLEFIKSSFKKYNLDITFTDATSAMVEKEKINTAELNAKKTFEIADIDKLDKSPNQKTNR